MQSTEVSYSAIRRRLTRERQPLRIKELRSYYATFLRKNGILAEFVDLIQGAIPKAVFVRHYLKIEDLKEPISVDNCNSKLGEQPTLLSLFVYLSTFRSKFLHLLTYKRHH